MGWKRPTRSRLRFEATSRRKRGRLIELQCAETIKPCSVVLSETERNFKEMQRGHSWAMRCREIVYGPKFEERLSENDRSRIASMLDVLLDHLREPVKWQ